MRRLAAAALAAALVSACSTKVDPTNPWDSDTPGPQKAKARITGVVKLAGVPAALVQVRLKQNGGTVDQTITLSDGTFIFGDLVPGAYVVETERTGFQKYAYPVSLAAGQAATLDADLTAVAGVQTGTLKGTALLQDQDAHGGILVEVHVAGSPNTDYTAITSSAGEYQIPVAAGTYDLRYVRSDFTNQVQTNVVASAGALTTIPEVVLAINPAKVSGTVLGETPTGALAPLDLADVTLQGAFTNKTDATGAFGFNNVVAGSYLLRVTKNGYEDDSLPVIGLVGGEDRVLADPFVLKLSRGAITGTVQLADSADASGAVVEATGTGVATVTGASGAFTLSGLVEGVYEVSVRKDGYAPAIRAGVAVNAGSSASVGTVTLARQGGAIEIVQGAVTQSRTITVRLNASSATGYRISQDPTFSSAALGDTLTSPASPRPYSGQGSTHDFTLDDLDGRHEIYVIFYDGTTASSPASASTVLDRLAPSNPLVAIENGAGYTKSTVVGLALSAQDLPAAANIEVSGLATMEIASNAGFVGSSAFTFAVSTTWPIGAGEGPKEVWVRFTDKAGNVSLPANATIVLDTTPPSAVGITLSGGTTVPAGFAGSPLVQADLVATDANAGTNGANLQVKLSNSSGLGGSTFQAFSSTVPWFVSAGDGLKTVYVQVMDPAGNVSVVANGTITLAATPPSGASLVVEAGAAATRKTTVDVAVSATGASQMRFFVNGAAATAWIPYATAASVPLGAAPDESTATLSASFRNVALVEGGGASDSIVIDRRAPTSPSLVVNGAAAFSRTTAVTLTTSAVESPAAAGGTVAGLDRVELSNDAAFATSTFVAYGTTLSWSLASGADGARTVYARFLDAAGNVSAAVNDGITLDTTAPSATTITLAGNPEAPAGFTGTPIVTATLAATDVNGGASNANLEVRLSNDLGFAASTWQPFAASMAWVLTPGDSPKTVYAQFRDAAGNVSSPPASASITLASTPPTNGSILVEGGAPATNKSAVPLAVTLSATGASQMRLFVNGAAATAWVPYATSATVPAASLPDEATAVIAVAFRNSGGLEGGNAATSILVDRRAPTSPSVVVNANATYAASTSSVLTLSAADAPATTGTAAGLASVQVSNDNFATSTTFPYGTALPWTLAAGADGARTVYVRFLDKAGNVSAIASDPITLDTLAPASPTIALAGNPEAPAGFTGTPVVTATLSATDANGGSGNANLEVRLSNDLGFAASSWQPYAASMAWVLTPGDNAKTVYAQFRDPAGNVSATASAGITLSSTAPSTGSIVVESGAAATNKSATPLNVTVAAANATQMRLSVNGVAATGWIPYATTTTLAASGLADEATAIISVAFRNAGGLEGASASTSILVDRRAPTSPTVSVNAAAAFAASTAVTLTLSASDAPAAVGGVASGLDRVQVSNDNFTTSTTLPYASSLAWTLAAGADGARTVYVRFLDKAGNVSAAVNDPITLDSIAPAAGTITLTGNPEATAGNTGTPVVTAALTTSDANGGAGNANLEVQLSNSSGFAGASWQAFTGSLAWVLLPGDGPKTVYARYRDPAGNVSAFVQANITLAATPPSNGSISLEGGAAATNKSAVPLNATVSATGATQMRLFVNGTAATGWIAYAASTTLAAAALPDETVANVSILFRNAGGLEGGSASTSILVDRRAPTSPTVSVNAAAAYAASTAVTLTVSASDAPAAASGVASGLASVQVSNDAAFATSTTFPYAASLAWTLAAGADGARTVYVRFLDEAGNVSAAVNDPITLDTIAPAAGTITLTGNPEATAGNTGTPVITAALTTSDANGGAGNANLEVQLSNSSGFAGASWQAFTGSLAWVLLPGDGAKTVYARFRDPAGNVSTFVQNTITLAATAPSNGSISLEGGAAATNKSAVPLNATISATGATQMRLFVNGTAATGWIAYAAASTVTASTLADETVANVSILFRNAGGLEGGGASTSILVDRRAPTSGAVVVSAGAAYAGSTAVTLAVSAVDAPLTTGTASGLASVQVSNDGFSTSTTFPMAATLPWTLLAGVDGGRVVSVRFVDKAGNVSASTSDAITLDTIAPTSGTLALTGNPEATAGSTGTPIVSAALTTSDTNGGSGNVNLEVQLSNSSGFAGATWQPFATPLAWVLTPGDGTKTVYARFRDPAGNVSTFIQANITLAATPPSSGTLILAAGASATSTQTVSAAVTATSATQMRFFVNGVADARGWITYATSTTVDLGATPNEATRVVSVSFRNVGGVEGGGTSSSIRFDTLAPNQGSLAITGTLGNGTPSVALTATPAVVLSTIPFTTNTDVTQMAVVQATTSATLCTAMFAAPTWQPAANSLTFVLTGADGAKRVCLLFRDAAGNFAAANAATANITLDTTPPTNPAFVNVTSTTQNVALAPRTGNPTITAATDTNGVTYQCVGGTAPGYGAQWTDCGIATTLPRPWNLIPNSENTLGVRARDNAYNYSPGSFTRIVHDDVAPTPPFIVELRSSRDSVTVIWDATADTDVVDYLVYYGNAPGDLTGTGAAQGASPIAVPAQLGQASGSFTLTGLTQGIPYYVAVEAVDAAGNRSGPSGERSAVPNKANPRLVSTFGATPRTTGYRATASKTFAYVGTNQGITQVDITTTNSPLVVGRAFLPDMVPVERAPLAVIDCASGAVSGHCVIPSGTTLEGDYRGDQDFYRAAAPVVFFPLTGTTTAPAVGRIQSILPSRPTHIVPYQANGVTYLLAIDLKGVRVYTLDATNPSLVRQVASVDHAAPVVEVLAAGLNGSELWVVIRANPQWFGGPTDVPVVLGYECADLPGDFYQLFVPVELGFGDRVAGDPEPTFAIDGGLFANYVVAGESRLSSFSPGSVSGATPVSTRVLSAAGNGAYPVALAAGFNQVYAWTEGGLSPPAVYQVNRTGLTLAAPTSRSVTNEPFAAQVARTDAGATTLLTIDPYTLDTAVRAVQRWDVSGTTISNGVGLFNQIRPEWFAWADHVMYVSQAGFINRVDVSNPHLPIIGNAFTPGAAIGGSFKRLLTHGRYLFAAFAPSILPGNGGVAIFRMTGTGGLQTNGNLLNPAPMRTLSFPVGVDGNDMAVAGRWLFATGSDGDLRVYNLSPTTAANNPANSVPTLVTTLVGSYGEIEARRDTSTVGYEAVVYATVGDTVVTLGWDGAAFTTLNAGVTFASAQPATSLDLAGNYLTVGTSSGSYLFSVAAPASPSATGAGVYPVAGPTRLQAGYLVGLAPAGDPSGPNFSIRSNGIIDGSIRFSGCTGGTERSIAHDAGLYAASCGRNGIALFTTSTLEGMRLSKTYDVSPNWSAGAAFATDGMIGWFGGPQVWTGSATDYSRFYQANEENAAEGTLSTPFNAMSVSGDTLRNAAFMAQADGVLYVAVNRSGTAPSIDAYEATTPYSFINRLTLVGTDQISAMVSDGEYLYIARNGGASTQVSAIDVRNPNAMLTRATATAIANRAISTLALSRDRLYAPLYQGAAAVNDILVYDVSTVQSSGTISALTTYSPGSEGSITGVDVVGNTIVYTMHDAIYAAPGYFLGIGTLSSNRDGAFGATHLPLITVNEPMQSPVIAGDNLYVASNLGLQAYDMRGWWNSGNNLNPGGGVSLADPLRINQPVKLHIEGPFAYLTGGTYRVFDLR